MVPIGQLALKIYAFDTEVLFSFLMQLQGTVDEEIPHGLTDSRFMEWDENDCPAFEMVEEGKKELLVFFAGNNDLFCLEFLILLISWYFGGPGWGSHFLQVRLPAGKIGQCVYQSLHSTLCVLPTSFLFNSYLK